MNNLVKKIDLPKRSYTFKKFKTLLRLIVASNVDAAMDIALSRTSALVSSYSI